MSFIQPDQNVPVGWAMLMALVSFLFGTAAGCWITFSLLTALLPL